MLFGEGHHGAWMRMDAKIQFSNTFEMIYSWVTQHSHIVPKSELFGIIKWPFQTWIVAPTGDKVRSRLFITWQLHYCITKCWTANQFGWGQQHAATTGAALPDLFVASIARSVKKKHCLYPGAMFSGKPFRKGWNWKVQAVDHQPKTQENNHRHDFEKKNAPLLWTECPLLVYFVFCCVIVISVNQNNTLFPCRFGSFYVLTLLCRSLHSSSLPMQFLVFAVGVFV